MSQLRILFITAGSPWPTNIGVNQRTHLLLRALQNCGKVDTVINDRYVHFTPEERDYTRKEFSVLRTVTTPLPGEKWPWKPISRVSLKLANRLATNIGGTGGFYKPDPQISSWLANRITTHHYDMIVGRYLKATASAGALAYTPVLLDMDDCDTQMILSKLDSTETTALKRLSLNKKLRSSKKILPKLVSRCAHVWITNSSDEQFVNPNPCSILPNIPFGSHNSHRPRVSIRTQNDPAILMVGSFAHQPNVRSVDRFLKNTWPVIRKQVPTATFRIVGFGMTDKMKARWANHKGVIPVGYAETLDEEYNQCDISIVPVFEGGGTKIKVLESLMHLRTCVIADHSHRGYENILKHKESLWVAENDDELAKGCITLLKNKDLRNTMAIQGQTLVAENFSRSRFSRIVETAVESVAQKQKGILRQSAAVKAY